MKLSYKSEIDVEIKARSNPLKTISLDCFTTFTKTIIQTFEDNLILQYSFC